MRNEKPARIAPQIAVVLLLAVAAYLLSYWFMHATKSTPRPTAPSTLPVPAPQTRDVLSASGHDAKVPNDSNDPELPPEPEPRYEINGKLLYEDEEAVPNVELQFTQIERIHPKCIETTRTATDGAFAAENLTAGTYAITVHGLTEIVSDTYVVKTIRANSPDAKNKLIFLGGNLHAQLSGKVIDEATKAPLPFAVVYVKDAVDKNGSSASAVCNERGEFSLITSEGFFTVTVTHHDYSALIEDRIQIPSAGHVFALDTFAQVEGVVVADESDAPVSPYQATAFAGAKNPMAWYPNKLMSTEGDDAGRFRFERMDADASTIRVETRGYLPAMQVVQDLRPGELRSGIVIRLKRAAELHGSVLTESRAPIAGAKLYSGEYPLMDPDSKPLAESNQDGAFQIDSLEFQNLVLYAVHPNYSIQGREVTPAQPAPRPIEFIMKPGGTIVGQITSQRGPVPGVQVGVNYEAISLYKRTDAEGNFAFHGLPAGEILVLITYRPSGNTVISMDRKTSVDHGQTVRSDFFFPIGNAFIEGVVTRDGVPEPRTNVRAILDDSATQRFTTGKDGAFRFDELPAGEVMIEVWYSGTISGAYRVTRELGDGETVNLSIDLNTLATVKGKVNGFQPGDTQVVVLFGERSVTPQNWAEVWQMDSITASFGAVNNRTGNYSVSGLAPGEYTILLVRSIEPHSSDQTRVSTTAKVVNILSAESYAVDLDMPSGQ